MITFERVLVNAGRPELEAALGEARAALDERVRINPLPWPPPDLAGVLSAVENNPLGHREWVSGPERVPPRSAAWEEPRGRSFPRVVLPSPDGTALAGLGGGRLTVWEAATGDVRGSFVAGPRCRLVAVGWGGARVALFREEGGTLSV